LSLSPICNFFGMSSRPVEPVYSNRMPISGQNQ
jgi:hypothetical protein